METIHLILNYTLNNCPKLLNSIDGEELMESLLMSYDSICVNWWNLFDVKLFIEDDVIFLADAFNELLEGFDIGDAQNIFLGDGALQATITYKENTIHMDAQYAPNLNKNSIQKKELTIDRQEYICAWKAMIVCLIDLKNEEDQKN